EDEIHPPRLIAVVKSVHPPPAALGPKQNITPVKGPRLLRLWYAGKIIQISTAEANGNSLTLRPKPHDRLSVDLGVELLSDPASEVHPKGCSFFVHPPQLPVFYQFHLVGKRVEQLLQTPERLMTHECLPVSNGMGCGGKTPPQIPLRPLPHSG